MRCIKMKKNIIRRGLLGFPLGIAIGYVITIITSAIWAGGYYAAVTPELIQIMGNEINAVILQTVLCGIVGSGFAMASVIWDIDSWSLARQSGVYFTIACVIMLPIAYLANWMNHSIGGVLSFVAVFIAIFVFVWITQYMAWKSKIKRLNDGIKKSDGTK